MSGILGKKVGMTRIIEDDGSVIPVSVIECTPNEVTQIKTTEKDGYPALVLGFDALKKPTKTKKFKHVSEFRLDADPEQKAGDVVSVESLAETKIVKITGTSKGRGFAGVIKRHNFSRGPETHGSHHHREPGSAGGTVTGTGRTPKGKRYPGHYGNETTTIKAKVIQIDTERNLVVVKGAIPGSVNGNIRIQAVK
jgi:large subunit ribosomal protein L3